MSDCLLIQGDNLDALKNLSDKSFDLIYLDPPFRSEQIYRNTKSAGETSGQKIFDDRWRWDDKSETTLRKLREHESESITKLVGGLELLLGKSGKYCYLLFMIERLIELKRLLAPSGSITLHCDQYASAWLRVVLDALFGEDNYLNTICWCYGLGGSSPRRFPRKHDDILWYSRVADKHFFNPPTEPARSQMMHGKMKKIPDFWYIPSINNMAHERTGYPTQKPLVLLERIVLACSPAGGRILDPFCGSGTTLLAALKHGHTCVGIDIAAEAIETTIRRFENEGFDRSYSLQKRN